MFNRKKKQHTMAAGTGSFVMHLGAKYVRIHKLELKGDDADVDNNMTVQIVDADGRIILAATALDGGTDDSTTKATAQGFSTFGVAKWLCPNEADLVGQDGVAVTDNQGATSGVIARSPVTVNLAAGSAGDVFELGLLVEHGSP
jgi:hypothetical protein